LEEKKLTKAKFGIPTLDLALGGGIPRGSVVLIEDEVGVEPAPLVMRFLTEALRKGEYGYVVATEHPFEYYSGLLSALGVNPEIVTETRRLIYIDAFTDPFSWGEYRSDHKHFIRNVSDTREVNQVVRSALMHVNPQIQIRGVIDSFSTLIVTSDVEKAPIAYLQHQIAAQKKTDRVLIMIVHADAHGEQYVRALEHMVDGVISLAKTELEEWHTFRTTLRIQKMPGEFSKDEFWYEFTEGKILITKR
jgi:KaiC/GvpD/RAD55 family RecA-like ATPase